MERVIFHVDVNSAFLSWTAVDELRKDPTAVDLRTIPSIIGGDQKTRHGIVTAKSIPAKKYGITTAMPVAEALRRCPDLVIMPGDFHLYHQESMKLMEILHSYSDIVQQASVDEAYVDVTENILAMAASEISREEMARFAQSLAATLKDEVRVSLGFTVNVGISTNKLLAKMASDFTKPDKVHTLFPEEVPRKMWPLPIEDLFGCGPSTAKFLKGKGVHTIGEAAKLDLELLKGLLGEKSGEYIYAASRGLGSDEVHTEEREAKSYSNERTVSHDLLSADAKEAEDIIRKLSESVTRRMERDAVYGRTVTVSVKTSDFRRRSAGLSFDESFRDANKMAETAIDLYHKLTGGISGIFSTGVGIRLIGVGAGNLDDGSFRQMNLFEWGKTREQELEEEAARRKQEDLRAEVQLRADKLKSMQDALDAKFGKGIVKKGINTR